MRRETDFLRNGVLQEIIAIRRRLEATCPLSHSSGVSACEPQLADLSRLYSLLENFCDRLQSPFSLDSLPLALQHTVQPWQERLQLQTQLPPTWQAEPLELTQLLVLLFKALLPVLAENSSAPPTSTLSLNEAVDCKTLNLIVKYETTISFAMQQSIEGTMRPFLETFGLFAKATCDVMFLADKFSLKLEWHSTIATASDPIYADASP